MIAITSISPSHANFEAQARAVQSWVDLGIKPFTMNHRREMPAIRNFKEKHGLADLVLVETDKTMFDVYERHYVEINAMIDFGLYKIISGENPPLSKKDNKFCLINSDIELHGQETLDLIESRLHEKFFIHACRHDYKESINEMTSAIPYGIDAFFFNYFTASQLKQNNFCMGQCWWDYWVPFSMIRSGVTVCEVNKPFAYHKYHDVQWSKKQWETAAKFFLEEHGDECRRLGFTHEGVDVREYIRSNSVVI